uniref:Uncharacterized protein n=1 Tax=Arundo donax TaxID=35708 RepID=A0A0A9HHG2_ARUDO
MEKTITLALATGHKRFSTSVSKLVENYAELLASHGLLKTAMQYLELLRSDEHSNELSILKDHIAFSTEDNNIASGRSSAPDNSHNNSSYLANQSSHDTPEPPRCLYQQVSQQHSVPNNAYMNGYQRPSSLSNGGYSSSVPYHAPPMQVFVPPNTSNLSGAEKLATSVALEPDLKMLSMTTLCWHWEPWSILDGLV